MLALYRINLELFSSFLLYETASGVLVLALLLQFGGT